MICPNSSRRPRAASALVAVVFTCFAVLLAANPADAAPPDFVVAGDGIVNDWGFHGAYHTELRALLTNPTQFGDGGIVDATYTIAAPRPLPLTSTSLDNIDVYFLAARDLTASEQTVIQSFVNRGGALVVNSNGPNFFDMSNWLGFTMSTRLVYGDHDGYDQTHQAPAPATAVAAQSGHPVLGGPFGAVSTYEQWHSVPGFVTVPASALVLARTTLSGPDALASGPGPSQVVLGTISNRATLAVIPRGSFTASSGPVIVSSDVDTYSNAYTTGVAPNNWPSDSANTLNGTGNGRLARNLFGWLTTQVNPVNTTTTTAPPTPTVTVPTPAVTAAGLVTLATPVRALDTRNGTGDASAGGAFDAGVTRRLDLSPAGVPDNASTVTVNLTAVEPTAVGYLTAFPGGASPGNVSNVNFSNGVTVANAAIVRLGAGATIDLYNSAGRTHVLVDVTGYTVPGGSRVRSTTPTRIKDTRTGIGGTRTAQPGEAQSLQVAGTSIVPAGATAVILNVTAVDPTASSYITVWPSDQVQPTVSNINTVAGTNRPNLVVVRLPTSGVQRGRINLFNAAGTTDLLVDVLGYATTGGSPTVRAPEPTRVLDTRTTGTAMTAGDTRTIHSSLAGPGLVVVNVTATGPTSAGYLTVFANNTTLPDTSNVNFAAGQSSPNLVLVAVGADGTFQIRNSALATHVLVDVVAILT